ncbi:NAD(P)-binding protein [Mytilinidion resinicola]|uniref:NAD(P)-binding protein n=1 Tax=Mytilinidion resinicola TaxID=574789 RepID=A0A6A6Z027_9PEZI|nr:NAD(P)-binding protein [Mytilinidion resinicola]KAF2814089.1 NAD(P)-binding protein [Mytilinidion resinicola]
MSTTPRISPGGLILVTGANGYIGSHLIDHLLKKGYQVRGTVRDATAQAWMTSHFGDKFSLVQVPDLSAPNALDEAVKGVNGIAHVASNVQFSPDAESFVPPVVQAAINVLEAAAKEPSVKSVVYCSSQAAMHRLNLNTPYELTADSWNDTAVEAAYKKDGAADMERMADVYSASKVLAERGSWEWVKKNQPHFVFNSVIPNVNFGGVVSLKHQGFRSSAGLVKALWDGYTLGTEVIQPQWCSYVEDTALLHIAALILPDVKNERVFAMAQRYDWVQILDLLKKLYPDHKFTLESLPDVGKDMGKVPTERSEELLRKMGKFGFSSLEEAIRKSVEPILEAEAAAEYPLTEMDRLMIAMKQQTPQE